MEIWGSTGENVFWQNFVFIWYIIHQILWQNEKHIDKGKFVSKHVDLIWTLCIIFNHFCSNICVEIAFRQKRNIMNYFIVLYNGMTQIYGHHSWPAKSKMKNLKKKNLWCGLGWLLLLVKKYLSTSNVI